MKPLDRFLQTWRIRKASPWIRAGDSVLDIGAYDCALARQCPQVGRYIAVDPHFPESADLPGGGLRIKGRFPDDVPVIEPVSVIVGLAVLEHVPTDAHSAFAEGCRRLLVPGGRAIFTVPSPAVDPILDILGKLRLIDGIELDQHYGFEVADARRLFPLHGFREVQYQKFQAGLNNLLVFELDGRHGVTRGQR